MKIKPAYEKELIGKTLFVLEDDVILNLQTVCLNLELMNEKRMEELSDLTLKLHSKLIMIRNEIEDYKNRIEDTVVEKSNTSKI